MIKYLIVVAMIATTCTTATAQQKQEKKIFTPEGDTSLPEVLISATKFPEKRRNVVQRVDIISDQYIKTINTQNAGDLLQSTGNIFVQKSQQGGSSPVIRGFEASRVLLMVDGIRMNNAIYRSGHLQNVITVDQNMLERSEVMFGPGSTLHGSDALGGVITFKTKMPTLAGMSGKTITTGNAFARYSSANKEKTGHADISVGGAKFGILVSGTFSDFDDMKMGDNYKDEYPDFGRRTQYVETIDGVDYVRENNDDRIQKFSGYKQWDVMGKILYKPSEKVSHLLNIQHSNSTDVPRYDRLQDTRNGSLRFAEWYYGPQTRTLAAYTLDASLNGFFQEMKFTASYQKIEESRYQRNRNNPLRQSRVENVQVGGLVLDFRKIWKQQELHTGFDVQLNDVKSKAFNLDITNNNTSKLDTRYPEKNNYHSAALYAQHVYKAPNQKIIINDGLRLQGTWLHSTIIDQSTSFRPFTDLKQSPVGLSGNAGLIYLPEASLRISTGVSSGFRAPNIDDLTKIFESSTASKQIVVANPDIKPEQTISPDINITKRFGKLLIVEIGAYYTWFYNAIVVDKFQLEGKDSISYNGDTYAVLAAQNKAKANIYGFNGAITLSPAKGFEITSTLNYTRGTYKGLDGSKVPLDHIPPVFGKTSIRYKGNNWSIEAWSMYNGWKRIADYNPSGEDNAQYATPEGMPSWATINFRAQTGIGRNLTLQAAVENITDRNYRVFASGFSAAGRNFILALRASF